MSERGPILCATDLGATGALAGDLAARMAVATKLPLLLVHVTAPGPQLVADDSRMSEAERVLRERLKNRIEAAAAGLERERQRISALGAEAESELLEGRPWEQIVECTTRMHASLAVVGPHGHAGPMRVTRGGLTEHILGTTADRVVRHASCPVLVGPREGGVPENVHGGRWIVAVDFSPSSRAALHVARELAKDCSAELVPLHVVPDVTGHEAHKDDPLRLEEASRSPIAREHLELLSELVHDELGPRLDVKVALGEPADMLSIAAEALHANLVVLGTRGRTGLSHLLLGSVAERTLRRSHVPVLCVRPQPEMD